MATTTSSPHSAAWAFQTKVSFVVSLTGLVLGLIYLPVDPWARAYLSAASLYAITSAINLSKAMRDEHEASRDGEAKLGRILADHDPFRAA